ncbi:hypothetical protein GS399_03090 [Pedobacter sp. HMF7647]|uniref:Uncharacterized protein n=1 Tax=Hufsiella arboris TaxID=2695275 RepID=A0A7K1Y5U4_9SPHI|nr:hypothetical protein [Hufsiella arboris]MXV49943.1 hypothetical protein [Hufsiella arboris]
MDAKNYNNLQSDGKINDFFDLHTLAESKKLLWQLLNAAACGNFAELSSIEKDNLFTFYSQLNELLDAVHHLNDCAEGGAGE